MTDRQTQIDAEISWKAKNLVPPSAKLCTSERAQPSYPY